jgi:hypothetical protein
LFKIEITFLLSTFMIKSGDPATAGDEVVNYFGFLLPDNKPTEDEVLLIKSSLAAAVAGAQESGEPIYTFYRSIEVVITPLDSEGKELPTVIPDPKDPIYLYIICRNDMESFTGTPDKPKTGLPCAQTGHAANQMVYQARKKNDPALNALLTTWENETGMGFGTEIVIGAHYSKIRQLVDQAKLLGFHASMVKDPEYPLKDGATYHFIPLETCAYIFGKKNELAKIMAGLDLLP